MGAQVARTTGVSETPDSSWKTIHAWRRRALFYTRPVLLDPAGDRLLIAFGRPPGRPLHRPAQLVQQPPHMTGVVPHPGDPLDHLGHPRQRPQLRRVPVRRGTPKQLLLHPRLLFGCQARRPTSPTRVDQRRLALRGPRSVPAGHALPAHLQPARHLRLRHTLCEQLRRLTTPTRQRLKVTPLTHRRRRLHRRRLKSKAFHRRWLSRRSRHDNNYLSELHACHSITRSSLSAENEGVDRLRVSSQVQ